jgi:ubiquinone/menaquinone biosynthesis C-methylase UbiE
LKRRELKASMKIMFHPKGPTFFELAQQALSSTERGYDLLAPKFDLTPFRTPEGLLAVIGPEIGPPGSVGTALDLCCGTGAAVEMLRPLCTEQIVGVDFSEGMLAEARRRLAGGEGGPSLSFQRHNVLALEFDAEFDVATCFGALGHILGGEQDRLLDGVYRALKPGGRFFFDACTLPQLRTWQFWFLAAFDASMAVRNLLWRPPFVMYYLTFLLPRAQRLLAAHGFEVEVVRDVSPNYPRLHLIVATRPE